MLRLHAVCLLSTHAQCGAIAWTYIVGGEQEYGQRFPGRTRNTYCYYVTDILGISKFYASTVLLLFKIFSQLNI